MDFPLQMREDEEGIPLILDKSLFKFVEDVWMARLLIERNFYDIVDSFKCLDETERVEAAHMLYWAHPYVPVHVIARALDCEESSVPDIVGPVTIHRVDEGEHCAVCGKPFMWYSRDDAKHPPQPYVCLSCLRKLLDEKGLLKHTVTSLDTRLEELRTMPYNQYLLTPEWKQRRRAALFRASYRCQICNSNERLHVHHRTYERLGAEAASDIIVLCCHCHQQYHFQTYKESEDDRSESVG
jgi:hypothetical protein